MYKKGKKLYFDEAQNLDPEIVEALKAPESLVLGNAFKRKETSIINNCEVIEGEFTKFWYYRPGGPLDGDYDLWIKLDNDEIRRFMGHGYYNIGHIIKNYRAGGTHVKGDRLRIFHLEGTICGIENYSLKQRKKVMFNGKK